MMCCGSLILCLQSHHVELLRQETEKVYPVEACAMLFGKVSQSEAEVKKVLVAENRLISATHFDIDPARVAAAVIEAEKELHVFQETQHWTFPEQNELKNKWLSDKLKSE